MSKNIFITGTSTDVGKTYISALLVKYLKNLGYQSSYYKTAASGNPKINDQIICSDAQFVKTFADIAGDSSNMVSYIFKEPLSPHLAGKKEKINVELSKIKKDFYQICSKSDFVTVEGTGGIICPLRYDEQKLFLEDVIKALDLSVIIVSNTKLGSINLTGLTVSYLKSKNISIKGIILNEYDETNFMKQDNKKMIEEITQVPVLACVLKNQKDIFIQGIETLYE